MSDPWIQSLVQSPLYRTLSNIPTNSDTYVHGIPDNAPLFSKQKIVVQPYVGVTDLTKHAKDQTFRFKIPQGGYLDRAYLKVRIVGSYNISTKNRLNVTDTMGHKQSSALNYCSFLDYVELRAHNHRIERIPGPMLLTEALKKVQSHGQRQQIINGTWGFSAGSGADGSTEIPSEYQRLFTGDASRAYDNAVDFIIPVPLSSTDMLKQNYQTRFTENLELLVKVIDWPFYWAEKGVGGDSGTTGCVPELVLMYHNFHPNVENTLRNSNYKQSIPATIYCSDWTLLERDTLNGLVRRFDLTNQSELVTEMTVVSRNRLYEEALVGSQSTYKYNKYWSRRPFHFALKASGRTIYEAESETVTGYEGADFSTAQMSPCWGEDSGRVLDPHEVVTDGTSVGLGSFTSSAVTTFRFGFSSSNEYFSGGIALSTLVNPEIIITFKDNLTSFNAGAGPYGSDEQLEHYACDIFIKHKCLVRIDSDTGVITKSLDN